MENVLKQLKKAMPNPANGLVIDADQPLKVNRPARIGMWAMALGFAGFLAWAAFAPLDEGVPAGALVAIDTKRKTIQHLTGGIVHEVLVNEGQQVKEGAVVMRLNDAVSRANFESVRQRYLGYRATESRLLAERQGLSSIRFHADLVAVKSDPLVMQQILTQEQLFASRRASQQAELRGLEESIQGQEALITAYQGMAISRKSQLSLLQEELANTRSLVAEGYAPRNRQLELERMAAESTALNTELQGNLVRASKAILELRQRGLMRQQEYRKEVETQLADIGRELQADAEKLKAVTDDLGRTEIKAPVAGQVVGLSVHTVGAVIQPGQKLMDIVPEDEKLILEARVPPHVIDRVHSDLPVDIRFNAFSNSPQLVVDGLVASVSGDLLTDPATNLSYYLARVAVTQEGLKKLGKRQMQPGMPAEVIFKTGERTLLTYVLHPLTKRVAASMTEE